MARRGVDLLLAHLNSTTDSLGTAMANMDEQAFIVASDPLVTVAAILIRMLRDATNGTVESALAAARKNVDAEVIPADEIEKVESLISEIISGIFPEPISCPPAGVAWIAHDIAIGAAQGISNVDGRHANKVVADLRVQLKEQGKAVQISDRDGALAAVEKYAADEEMRKIRNDSAFQAINYWNRAAYVLYKASVKDDLSDHCQDSLEALALVAVTAKALSAGIFQLVRLRNLYPAWTLLRQLASIFRDARVWSAL
jgi:hypothetical protein